MSSKAPQVRPLVLVVDDVAPLRHLLSVILAEAGYDVIQASDGEEAVEAVRQCAPCLVITDLVMPQKDGLETIAAVRRIAPQAKIIAISGAFGGRFLNVAAHMGADATLAKPISADVLLQTVSDTLARD